MTPVLNPYVLLMTAGLMAIVWLGNRIYRWKNIPQTHQAQALSIYPGAEQSDSHGETVTPVYLRNVNITRLDVNELPAAGNDASRALSELVPAEPEQPESILTGPVLPESVLPGAVLNEPSSAPSRSTTTVQALNTVPLTESMRLRASLNQEKYLRRLSEQKLSDARAQLASLEDQLLAECSRRQSVESRLSGTRQSLVKARIQLRRSHAARAEALSTANKSVALARQSVRARAHLESELAQVKKSLSDRRDTISTLLTALRSRHVVKPVDNPPGTESAREGARL